jgi:hypothetical protein
MHAFGKALQHAPVQLDPEPSLSLTVWARHDHASHRNPPSMVPLKQDLDHKQNAPVTGGEVEPRERKLSTQGAACTGVTLFPAMTLKQCAEHRRKPVNAG